MLSLITRASYRLSVWIFRRKSMWRTVVVNFYKKKKKKKTGSTHCYLDKAQEFSAVPNFFPYICNVVTQDNDGAGADSARRVWLTR